MKLKQAVSRTPEPQAYRDGWTEFLGARIDLSLRPLIPRPETEWWVEQAMGEAGRRFSRSSVLPAQDAGPDTKKSPPRFFRVLDMFAGSGCVGIAALRRWPEVRVDFGEVDPQFCKQMEINLKLNNVVGRARVIQSDIFSNLPDKYDVIFANPPYCVKPDQSVLDWEPRRAVLAGEDGLALIRRFLEQAPVHLNPGGRLYMEFDSPQKPAIGLLLKGNAWICKKGSPLTVAEFHPDQYGSWRWLAISADVA